jgi:F0F1-type ATP synthase gamma subunit
MVGWNPRDWKTGKEIINVVNEFWPDIFNDNRNRKMNITIGLMADEIITLREQIEKDKKKITIAEDALEYLRTFDADMVERYNLGSVRECQIIFTEFVEKISRKCYKTQNEISNCEVSQR